MDKRSFLKGLAALVAVAATPVVFKTNVLASTSLAPIPKKEFHRYDSVAMAYVKKVVGRTTPLPVVTNNVGKPLRHEDPNVDWYRHTVPADPVRAAFYLAHDQQARAYFKTLPKQEMDSEYWGK